MPLFDLEQLPSLEENPPIEPATSSTLNRLKMDTILEIEGS
jgi:hypothetical protein